VLSICGVSIRKDLADFKSLENMNYVKRSVRVGSFDVHTCSRKSDVLRAIFFFDEAQNPGAAEFLQ
jgi:hypothetical protein